jgi:chromosome segregation ATPase
MARAGIYKSEVVRARRNLLALGRHPSIDAIRIELGNTGSKATIHRYLKEIEEEEGGTTDAKKLPVSEALQDLIGRLAERLRGEADERIAATNQLHQAEVEQLQAESKALHEDIAGLRKALAVSEHAQEAERGEHAVTRQQLNAESVTRAQFEQQVGDLRELLEVEERHRQSLDQKFQDARRSLEHFREAAINQRELELRQHEQQVQYLQSEVRGATQALIEQQHKVAAANRDLAQLTTELAHATHALQLAQGAARELEQTKMLLATNEHRCAELERRLVGAEAAAAGLDLARQEALQEIAHLTVRSQSLEVQLATSQTKADTEEQILERVQQQVARWVQEVPRVRPTKRPSRA